ncbi:nicotinate (nicotinamide) nucleotide adenylyltransferase [Puia dinghuensis]|uniref:Probable nicotinate-nucleotide adenylyltransferase n=1 Tax=Puia dinghuensis TaxID=1792502 RepID=A0A8J2XV76_9BACT|nr:nicotinate (nicotinamide) nucleotide adenylyltransferase [Puia dinghuensis]GGB10734.1 putative nicotinate-nucleotide adenylyltransferase [Puia dinghuensis]
MKIGLYFGSFNPIHHGHLLIAMYILQNTSLQQVWFVVSPQNPLKPAASLLNEYHRLYLVQLAIEGEKELKALDIEFKLPKPSYTVDTLAYLQEKYPTHEFSVIMGSDSFQNLPKWKNADWLLRNYSLYVYKRPEHEHLPNYPGAKDIHILSAPLLPISSTHIRQRIKEGISIRYLVPEAVRLEIERNGYYS